MKNPLFDANFLKQLDLYPHKNKYVRIISLDKNDFPREQIEGVVTGGFINIDGASAVRRTCSLTFAVPDPAAAITDAYWAFDNKFKLEIGLKNDIDSNYPNIIWFKQGVYVATSFSKSISTNGISISISGKDKMCRLNGEVGGNISAQWDFGQIEEVDANGNITLTKLTIYQIIREAISQYGQERLENIIINDLDEHGWELWEYRGDQPMYLFLSASGDKKVINMTFNGDTEVQTTDYGEFKLKDLGTKIKAFQFYSLNTLDSDYNKNAKTIVWDASKLCYIVKIENGDTAGYHQTPLVYNTDLILNAGETLTSLLDKLKSMLGEFEYFYDLDGHFVFQRKKNYVQELFSPINGEIIQPTMLVSPYNYKFDDEKLFTNISESPQINNVKNDFIIWGTRKGIAGADIPIHARYAIDKKPQTYCSPWGRYESVKNYYFINASKVADSDINNKLTDVLYKKVNNNYEYIGTYRNYNDLDNKPDEVYKIKTYLTYTEATEDIENKANYLNDNLYEQIGSNYKKVNLNVITSYYWKDEDLNYTKITEAIITTNPNFNLGSMYQFIEKENRKYCSYQANIENYVQVDWRELIYQMAIDYYKHNKDQDFLLQIENENPLFIGGKTGYEQYYVDVQGFWRQLYNPAPTNQDLEQYGEFYDVNDSDPYWNKKIHTDPASINFWFDFLDVGDGAGISKYAVYKVGDRTKVDNNTSVKSIYFKETPEVQFVVIPTETWDANKAVYSPIWIQDNMQELFVRSSQGLSAISRVNELISQHTTMSESISLTAIPIYYLEPNTRIYLKDRGDYVLTKISYQLNYNGTMSLNATKIIDTIY